MKKNCTGCHFFMIKTDRLKKEINQKQREEAQNGNFSWVGPEERLSCYFGVWGEELRPINRNIEIIDKERDSFCFYWAHKAGMLWPAAEILQKRESEALKASKERRLVIIGLWIAACALFIDALFRLFNNLF